MECVERTLLTPVGLRTLAPGEKEYKAKYYGNLRARDAAYHQGTVWPWLIGPYVDAWLKLHPDELDRAEKLLQAFEDRLGQNAVGSIGEIFDAEPPYTHRGCVAQGVERRRGAARSGEDSDVEKEYRVWQARVTRSLGSL